MAATKKYINHNGKEIKIPNGKNVRINSTSHEIILRYCIDKMLKMGAFVEKCALDKIPESYKSTKK